MVLGNSLLLGLDLLCRREAILLRLREVVGGVLATFAMMRRKAEFGFANIYRLRNNGLNGMQASLISALAEY